MNQYRTMFLKLSNEKTIMVAIPADSLTEADVHAGVTVTDIAIGEVQTLPNDMSWERTS